MIGHIVQRERIVRRSIMDYTVCAPSPDQLTFTWVKLSNSTMHWIPKLSSATDCPSWRWTVYTILFRAEYSVIGASKTCNRWCYTFSVACWSLIMGGGPAVADSSILYSENHISIEGSQIYQAVLAWQREGAETRACTRVPASSRQESWREVHFCFFIPACLLHFCVFIPACLRLHFCIPARLLDFCFCILFSVFSSCLHASACSVEKLDNPKSQQPRKSPRCFPVRQGDVIPRSMISRDLIIMFAIWADVTAGGCLWGIIEEKQNILRVCHAGSCNVQGSCHAWITQMQLWIQGFISFPA